MVLFRRDIKPDDTGAVARALIFAALLWLLSIFFLAVQAGQAAVSPQAGAVPKALKLGSHGKPVKDLEWLLAGNAPSAFKGQKFYRGPIDGIYGPRVARSVFAAKYRLGWKKVQVDRVAGVLFQGTLRGKVVRTPAMVARAAYRLRLLAAAAARLRKLAQSAAYREVHLAGGQVGIHESPDGSNRGPGISYPTSRTSPSYQSITGAYGAAWCASFVQWLLYKARLATVAGRSAGVFYIKDWAWRDGLLRAVPKAGYLVAFLRNNGHIGLVTGVTRYGIYTIEGNTSNGVYRRSYGWHETSMVFIQPPGVQ